MTRFEIRIDRDTCMGSGNCTYWAPGVFDMDDDCIAVVVHPSAATEEALRLAVDGCPTGSISFVEVDAETPATTTTPTAEPTTTKDR
jgi:ferredoxin